MTYQSMDELLAAAKDGGSISISSAEFERLEAKRDLERLMDAARRFRDGDTDWHSLSHMMGSHRRPELLSLVWHGLARDQLITALSDSWAMCDAPEKCMPRRHWLPIFRAVGYHGEEQAASPPDSITLWRGGTRRTGMSWTADRERAEWFQHRWEHIGTPGKLWSITVGPDRLLAHYHEKHRHEDEYVIDPTGIRPKEVR